ncbi:glycosyltransferase [uncultured Rhodoblastus sp.]|uniref:glycosyltransferase family 32 protein n=1 Tax=uncultured Rhodoblastus sp. TaxID=543037 RepID=UPI0025E6E453|nr:glycosyltransferase [uncultured Rhodoblastus sp.]
MAFFPSVTSKSPAKLLRSALAGILKKNEELNDLEKPKPKHSPAIKSIESARLDYSNEPSANKRVSNTSVKYIHQIFIQADGELPKSFPQSIAINTRFVRELYPDAIYHLYSGNEIRTFIKTHFGERVIRAYDTLAPFAYKCDLARLCLLYIYGGLYVDLGIRILFPLKIKQRTKILLFRCPIHHENHPWDVENSLMYTVPKREEFSVAIDIICSNVENRFYGVNTLAPTGPGVIGRAIAIVGAEQDYSVGFSSVSNTQLPVNFFNYILQDGTFVATRTKDGRLNVVIKSANNYNDFWHSRTMYGEDTVFLAKDFKSRQIEHEEAVDKAHGEENDRRLINYIEIPENADGCVIWGPYKYLREGRYKAVFVFTEKTDISGLKIVFFDKGIGVLHEEILAYADRIGDSKFMIDFINPFDSRFMETMLYSNGKSSGGLVSVTFKASSPDEPIVFLAKDFKSRATESLEINGKLHDQKRRDYIEIFKGSDGCVIWGPYKSVKEGRYKVTLTFIENTDVRGLKIAFFDKGIGTIYEEDLTAAEPGGTGKFLIDFHNPFDATFIETRLHSDGQSSGALVSITLEPTSYKGPIVFLAKDFISKAVKIKEASSIKMENVRKREKNIAIMRHSVGCVIWGPYRFLKQGRYKVAVLFTENTNTRGLKIDIYDRGLGVIYESDLASAENAGSRRFVLEFDNPFNLLYMETRFHSKGRASGALVSVTFELIEAG